MAGQNLRHANPESFMLRTIIPTVALLLALPLGAQAASLAEFNLNKSLQATAAVSNEGKPREITQGLTDNGFTVDGTVLTNHLVADQELALNMLKDKNAAALALGRSVCSNAELRKLLARGAVVRLDVRDNEGNIQVLSQDIGADNCHLKK